MDNLKYDDLFCSKLQNKKLQSHIVTNVQVYRAMPDLKDEFFSACLRRSMKELKSIEHLLFQNTTKFLKNLLA